MATLTLGIAVFLLASLCLSLGVLLGRPTLRRGCNLSPAGLGQSCETCTRSCDERAGAARGER